MSNKLTIYQKPKEFTVELDDTHLEFLDNICEHWDKPSRGEAIRFLIMVEGMRINRKNKRLGITKYNIAYGKYGKKII